MEVSGDRDVLEPGIGRGGQVKLNQSTNFRVEDFPDQADWIGRLFTLLNSFVTSVGQIVDQNIDYTTNIKSLTKDFEFSSLTYPITFQWPFTQAQPLSLSVNKATKDGSAIILLPAWTYNASTQALSVAYLAEVSSTGVVAATTIGPKYKFTIRATI